ncbi:hypothetical protein P4T70_25650 [Bacillus mobilis]|uniref:hypothetical protein n=1 Tax=Bacillus mobilis TaxID=2026190 RepID=UPI002E1BBF0B|nr:hypothetical protein [Bacillus mobilis]
MFTCGFVSRLILLLNKRGHEDKGYLLMSLGVILIIIGSYSHMIQTGQNPNKIQEERLKNVAEELNLPKNAIDIVYNTNNVGRVLYTKGNYVVHFIGESSVILRLKSEVNLDKYCWF